MRTDGPDSNELCCREELQLRPHHAASEEILIHAAQAGMPGAMDELLVRHRGALYGAARRFTDNHEDAEDLVQDAMLRAFINIQRFRGEARFGTWLTAIVNNAALSMKRKKKTACWISIDDTGKELYGSPRWDLPDSHLSPEQEIIWEELLSILKTAISAQSPEYQIVVQACMFNEQSIREAAPALGLTIGSAKSRLFRARRGLLESFVKRGLVKRRAINRVGTVGASA
jgi:RNA polymerase sigma-70 factor (ECF subfamily)